MTTLSEQISKKSNGFQGIENNVSFSGADIDVIAYRSYAGQSPVAKFKVDNLKEKLQEADQAINQAKVKVRDAETQIAALNNQQTASADKVKRYRSLLPEGSSAMSSLIEKEGKFQNKISEVQTGGLLQAQVELTTANTIKQIIEEELAEIESGDSPYFKLGSLHTISYSSFREKFAVRTLGRTQARAYSRGPRTVAGTMIFNMFQEHDFLRMVNLLPDKNTSSHPYSVMIDQIEPFNLLLLFANEYGAYSALHLFDVEISSEGQEMSIDQIITHNTMNFYAKEMVPMMKLGNRFSSYDEMIAGSIQSISESGVASGRTNNRNRLDSFDVSEEVSNMLAKSRGLF